MTPAASNPGRRSTWDCTAGPSGASSTLSSRFWSSGRHLPPSPADGRRQASGACPSTALALPEGRRPAAASAGLRRRGLARARPAARLGHRGPVRSRDQPTPGLAPVLRGRLVPEALRGAGVGPGPVLLVEIDGAMSNATVFLNGRELGGRPYGYIGFAFDLTPHLRLRWRERPGRPTRARAGVLALVSRRGPLPPRLDRGHRAGARGAVGHLRDDAGRERGRGHGRGAHRASQPRDAIPPASRSRR